MADTLVVSIAEAKTHLRVTGTQEDAYIEGLILAVQDFAARWQGLTWLTQTWVQTFDTFPSVMYLRNPPLIDITKIEYVDLDGSTKTIAKSVYRVDTVSEPGRVTPAYNQVWPSTLSVTNAVTVTYTAGYGASASAINARWKAAVLLGVGHLYAHREAVSEVTMNEVPMAFYDLLYLDRNFGRATQVSGPA